MTQHNAEITDYQRTKLINAISNVIPLLGWFDKTDLSFKFQYHKRTNTRVEATISIKINASNV